MTLLSLSNRAEDGQEDGSADAFVLGGGPVGVGVARTLQADGRDVALIDESTEPSDVPVVHVDPTDVTALATVGLESASVVVVATPSDSQNLLVAQLVRARFGVDRVLVLANDPERIDALADASLEPVCATTALATTLADRVKGEEEA